MTDYSSLPHHNTPSSSSTAPAVSTASSERIQSKDTLYRELYATLSVYSFDNPRLLDRWEGDMSRIMGDIRHTYLSQKSPPDAESLLQAIDTSGHDSAAQKAFAKACCTVISSSQNGWKWDKVDRKELYKIGLNSFLASREFYEKEGEKLWSIRKKVKTRPEQRTAPPPSKLYTFLTNSNFPSHITLKEWEKTMEDIIQQVGRNFIKDRDSSIPCTFVANHRGRDEYSSILQEFAYACHDHLIAADMWEEARRCESVLDDGVNAFVDSRERVSRRNEGSVDQSRPSRPRGDRSDEARQPYLPVGFQDIQYGRGRPRSSSRPARVSHPWAEVTVNDIDQTGRVMNSERYYV